MSAIPTVEQTDLFGRPAPTPAAELRKEEQYGMWDASCGWSLPNDYSRQISGDRLEAYTRGFREDRARGRAAHRSLAGLLPDPSPLKIP
jgi:hypothetical protein